MTKININKIAFLLGHPVMIDHYMPLWKTLDKNKFTIVVTEKFKNQVLQFIIKLRKSLI